MVRHWRTVLGLAWITLGVFVFRAHRGLWYPPRTEAHETLDVAGFGLLTVGSGLRLWASTHIRSCKGRSLITSGPYALCRHPLYLGSLFALLGLCLIAQSTWIVIGSVLLWIPAYLLKMYIEETRLASRFGGRWMQYQKTIPLLIPHRMTARDCVSDAGQAVLSDALAELPGILVFVALAIILEMVEYKC